ncbi:uncharacterized protein LOC114260993 [Camellia sinensis]|uniref:uncharacterized protein LOC114260993 n=1 Tax=Camellia sinensis TaxID=4442 RepID=UPI001035FFB6|nr:uncharacterized protein LOC114260993 [Camellia sinensis]
MDHPRWAASSIGMFSVSSLIWNNVLPPKMQFFGWLMWKHKIKTSVFLQKIGVLTGGVSTLCYFCKEEEESVRHVLLHCPFVWNVWSSLLKWWGLQWVIPDSVAGLLSWWESGKLKKRERKIWKIVPVALWSIWKLRNDCLQRG